MDVLTRLKPDPARPFEPPPFGYGVGLFGCLKAGKFTACSFADS